MSYLALAQKLCGELGIDLAAERDGPMPPAAVLIRSRPHGEVWLALEPSMAPVLAVEEAQRPDPRPVLLAEDVARLRGKPEGAIRAAVEAATVWPGARVLR